MTYIDEFKMAPLKGNIVNSEYYVYKFWASAESFATNVTEMI